jgi:hypothetical protein
MQLGILINKLRDYTTLYCSIKDSYKYKYSHLKIPQRRGSLGIDYAGSVSLWDCFFVSMGTFETHLEAGDFI